jgi:hypothetical protein
MKQFSDFKQKEPGAKRLKPTLDSSSSSSSSSLHPRCVLEWVHHRTDGEFDVSSGWSEHVILNDGTCIFASKDTSWAGTQPLSVCEYEGSSGVFQSNAFQVRLRKWFASRFVNHIQSLTDQEILFYEKMRWCKDALVGNGKSAKTIYWRGETVDVLTLRCPTIPARKHIYRVLYGSQLIEDEFVATEVPTDCTCFTKSIGSIGFPQFPNMKFTTVEADTLWNVTQDNQSTLIFTELEFTNHPSYITGKSKQYTFPGNERMTIKRLYGRRVDACVYLWVLATDSNGFYVLLLFKIHGISTLVYTHDFKTQNEIEMMIPLVSGDPLRLCEWSPTAQTLQFYKASF